MRALRSDDGIVTVVSLSVALVLAAATALVTVLAGLRVVRHRAESAADLAALAAAGHALEGAKTACAAAGTAARAQHAVLETCRLEGVDAVVVVSLRPAGRLGALGVIRARARAGAR